MTDFVHLHLHTEYSLLDGAAKVQKIAGSVGLIEKLITTENMNIKGLLIAVLIIIINAI